MDYSEAFDGATYSLKLWPEGKMPGKGASEPEHDGDHTNNVLRVTAVSEPAMYVWPCASAPKPAPCMIICPGGGYSILAWDLEGTEIAEFLNSQGMSAIVLKYRCPGNREGALQDAQRAIRLARQHAGEWGIDPQCIGIMGFSAGGHLTASATCLFNKQTYETVDEADALSARPDFAVPVYSAYLNGADGKLIPELQPLEDLPPVMVIHNADDSYSASSLAFANGICAAGFDCCLRFYRTGGHGYGLRSTKDVKDWGRAMVCWFREKGFLKG